MIINLGLKEGAPHLRDKGNKVGISGGKQLTFGHESGGKGAWEAGGAKLSVR